MKTLTNRRSRKSIFTIFLTICIPINLTQIFCHEEQSNSTSHLFFEPAENPKWIPMLQTPRDEFNTSESLKTIGRYKSSLLGNETPGGISANQLPSGTEGHVPLAALRQVLSRSSYSECCLPWKNLTQNQEIQDELKRRFGKSRSSLRPGDLFQELKRNFLNVTYLSIDGQVGWSEREKYYNFYDGVLYFLRLLKVAKQYIRDQIGGLQDIDFNSSFKRQLRSIEFKASRDPVLSSYLRELLNYTSPKKSIKNTYNETTILSNNILDRSLPSSLIDDNDSLSHLNQGEGLTFNENFEYYEDFIRFTQFGRYYASNVSMIRESALVFDQIVNHLTSIDFPSNYTRPSKQYEMIKRMSHELYLIRNEIIQKISIRVRSNRPDALRIISYLNELTESRPYIRMLGDEFSSTPPYFTAHVRQLTHLLDLYLTNNLTHVSFYDQLSDLPQEFIILGTNIAHDYENKEISQYSRFESDFYQWPNAVYQPGSDRMGNNINASDSSSVDGRRSSLSLFTRLFH